MKTTPAELLADCESLVVISPHLDDASLSCGALLAACRELAIRTTVITVFNGEATAPLSDAAREFHAKCGLGDDAMTVRAAEDDSALAILGVGCRRLGMPEALYRRDANGAHRYAGGQDIFVERDDTEPGLVSELTDRLMGLCEVREASILLAPLGVGSHVDHLAVAAAVRRLERPSSSILWYEEVPYILYEHHQGWESVLMPGEQYICRAEPRHWRSKIEAIDCYRSQHPILWFDPDRRERELIDYGESLGTGTVAERYWGRK